MARRPRATSEEDIDTIRRLAHSRTAPARAVQRARIVWLAHQGQRVPAIAQELQLTRTTVRRWLKRFNRQGLTGLKERPRSGRPATDSPEQVSAVIATALTDPKTVRLPFACWTLARLQGYLNEGKGIGIKRTRMDELLVAEGWRWRQQETWGGARVDPAFAEKRGASRRSPRRRHPIVASSAWMRGGRRAPRVFRDRSWYPSRPPRRWPQRSGRRPLQRGAGWRAPSGGPLRRLIMGAGARAMALGPASPPTAKR
jgi:transposase